MNEYTKGEVVVLEATFTDDNDDAASATNVELRVERTDGAVDGPLTPIETSTGVYEYSYATQTDGTHEYAFESDDGGIEEGEFYVAPRTVPASP